MGLYEFRLRFRGREFWRSINKGIFVGIYSTLVFGVMLFPMFLGWIGLIIAIFLPSYIAFFINHLREMEKRKKGNKVIEGWITHAYGVGERFHLYPKKFTLSDKLSEDNLESVNRYIKTLKEISKLEKPEIGLDRFQPKQLSFKEITEKKKKDEQDLRTRAEKEKEEFERYEKELKGRKEWEKEKEAQILGKIDDKEQKITIEKGESKNGKKE